MGNNQSSGSGSGSAGSGTRRDWEYTPRNGGDGTASDAAWQGAKQGFKEFFQSPITETAKAAESFQRAGDLSDALSGKRK